MNFLQIYKYDILSFVIFVILLLVSCCLSCFSQTWYYTGNCANGSCYAPVQQSQTTEPATQDQTPAPEIVKPEPIIPEPAESDLERKKREIEQTEGIISESIDKAVNRISNSVVERADVVMTDFKDGVLDYLKSIAVRVIVLSSFIFSGLFYAGHLIGKLLSILIK